MLYDALMRVKDLKRRRKTRSSSIAAAKERNIFAEDGYTVGCKFAQNVSITVVIDQ